MVHCTLMCRGSSLLSQLGGAQDWGPPVRFSDWRWCRDGDQKRPCVKPQRCNEETCLPASHFVFFPSIIPSQGSAYTEFSHPPLWLVNLLLCPEGTSVSISSLLYSFQADTVFPRTYSYLFFFPTAGLCTLIY